MYRDNDRSDHVCCCTIVLLSLELLYMNINTRGFFSSESVWIILKLINKF